MHFVFPFLPVCLFICSAVMPLSPRSTPNLQAELRLVCEERDKLAQELKRTPELIDKSLAQLKEQCERPYNSHRPSYKNATCSPAGFTASLPLRLPRQMRPVWSGSSRSWSRAGRRRGRQRLAGRRLSRGRGSRSRPSWRRAESTWSRPLQSCSACRRAAGEVRQQLWCNFIFFSNLDLPSDGRLVLCPSDALEGNQHSFTPDHTPACSVASLEKLYIKCPSAPWLQSFKDSYQVFPMSLSVPCWFRDSRWALEFQLYNKWKDNNISIRFCYNNEVWKKMEVFAYTSWSRGKYLTIKRLNPPLFLAAPH